MAEAQGNVISLARHRSPHRHRDPEYDGLTCPSCGGKRFNAYIELDGNGQVTSYSVRVTCNQSDCGIEIEIGDA